MFLSLREHYLRLEVTGGVKKNKETILDSLNRKEVHNFCRTMYILRRLQFNALNKDLWKIKTRVTSSSELKSTSYEFKSTS